MVEVHDSPLVANSDGLQALTLQDFQKLMEKAKQIAKVMGKDL